MNTYNEEGTTTTTIKAKSRKPKPSFHDHLKYAFFHPTNSSAAFDTTATFSSSVILATSTPKPPAVKVYLCDLPRRFTHGVIYHHSLARGLRADENDMASLNYTGHQHMAEWSDRSRSESNRAGLPLVKVLDLDEADLFFVLFILSLRLIVNLARPVGSNFGSECCCGGGEELL